MIIKRKSAVYSVIALMLCVAVYLNWSYQRDGGDTGEVGEFDDPKILGESQLVDKTEATGAQQGDEQFEIADGRSFAQMYHDMDGEGLQPVLNDYL